MISVLTCTGDRPYQFSLCEKYVERQTYQDFQWIVVDDGKVETKPTRHCQYLRLSPQRKPVESFRSNMLAGLSAIKTDIALIMEDDDWYAPNHIQIVMGMLRDYRLVGDGRCRYYNVRHRAWKVHPNRTHASLAQIGFHIGPIRPKMMEYLKRSHHPETLDGGIFKRSRIPLKLTYVNEGSRTQVSIKGMSGRSGLGCDHRKDELLRKGYHHDPDMNMLEKWIGSDVAHYKQFYDSGVNE